MPPKCILFYKTAAADERLEAVLDRESTAGRLELLGVSAEEQSMVPPARRTLPFFSPAAISGVAFDYAVVIEATAGEKRDRARSRVKRLLPPFLLRLHYKIAAWRFTRKKRRLWQSFDGWGKPIERQPDMVLPERSPLGAWSIPAAKTIPARTFLLPGFRMDEYAALRTRGITFLSDNCWGGLMYHTLGMEMTSPFINMFVWTDDFIRLINDLPYYLSQPLVPEKLRERRGAAYPVVLLGDVRLHFNHVTTPDELTAFAEKWYRRRDRMDMDTLFIESSFDTPENQAKYESGFAACPYPKLIFTPYPSEKYVYLSALDENAARYKGDFSDCTRDCAKNDYPGEIPLDFLRTFLTRTAQPPKEEK